MITTVESRLISERSASLMACRNDVFGMLTSSIGRIHVCVQRLCGWARSRMGRVPRRIHLFGGRPIDRIELTRRQLTRLEHTTTERLNWIVDLPRLRQLVSGAVGLRITAIMSMDAHAARFDEAR